MESGYSLGGGVGVVGLKECHKKPEWSNGMGFRPNFSDILKFIAGPG